MNNKPNYLLRQFVAAIILAVTILFVATVAVNAVTTSYTCENVTHITASGDTLWSIAEQYCVYDDIRDVVDDLERQYGANIYPGDIIIIK